MGTSQYISLKDASLLTNRSQQTVRRLIKSNKVRYRKYKTPQGFTYLVERTSLLDHFGDLDELNGAELIEEFNPIPNVTPMAQPEYTDQCVVQPIQVAANPTAAAIPTPMPTTPVAAPTSNPIQTSTPQPEPARVTPPTNSAGNQTVVNELIRQHREDKNRLFQLLETFQKRILILEDQIKQLEAPKEEKKRWYQLFKR